MFSYKIQGHVKAVLTKAFVSLLNKIRGESEW